MVFVCGSMAVYAQENLSADSLARLARSVSFSNPDKCLQYSERLLRLAMETKNKEAKLNGYYYKGTGYYAKGFYKAAIENYLEALKLAESLHDTTRMANCYMVLGIVYYQMKDYAKAETNYSAAASIYRVQKNMQSLSGIENNIGLVQQAQAKYPEARESFKNSLRLLDQIGADSGAYAPIYQNIGLTYSKMNQCDTAMLWFMKALPIVKQGNNKLVLARAYSDISSASLVLGQNNDALYYGRQALALAEEVGNREIIETANAVLYEYYMAIGDIRIALKYHLAADSAHDSLLSEQNTSDIARLETEFEYEKIRARDSVQNAEREKVTTAQMEKQEAELKARKNQQIALFSILALVAIFSIFIYNRFRLTKKQKHIIEEQKNIVELKQKEITDSINYAKRIQTAVLPPLEYFTAQLPQSFIFYKPKDIVAGDFYWMEIVGQEILFAACDCTGHGVPGAIVSMICNNALNRAVREFGLSDPGKILDKARTIIISEFEKSLEDVKDGMDISLCALNKTTGTLRWAGANNPLWIIRGKELMEFRPDKQPIGKHSDPKPFTTHTINLLANDMLYIFTDGYQDQFGGEKGKKFKISAMRNMLMDIYDKRPEEQQVIIKNAFENWKSRQPADGTQKDYYQVDDVCVIGIRIG
jgi:serine phosphatase RsbU (regulator of sigma subunit)